MECRYFNEGRCRSCALMGVPYEQQLAEKQARCAQTLADVAPVLCWLEPQLSRESGFRNKAKLMVGGAVGAVTLGILDGDGHGIDLRECGLYEPRLSAAIPALAAFVNTLRLTPYDVPGRRGELKYLIVTHSPDGELMVRLVMRSDRELGRLRSQLDEFAATIAGVQVVSVNLHPEHKAVLEGDDEVVLSGVTALPMRFEAVTLYLRPRSFFQTNTVVAQALYAQARAWVDAVNPVSVWDLFCGVGGFALHAASADRSVVGVELSADAAESARFSARECGLDAGFITGDAGMFVRDQPPPELVIVNPPRRGLTELAAWLETSGVKHVIYSSCNPESLARDLARMPSYQAMEGRVFDMFPHTTHLEVMVRLERR